MNQINNRTLITIAAFVVLALIVDRSIIFAWDWFRGGRPDPGALGIALSVFGAGSLGALVTWGFTLWRTRLTQQQIALTSQNSRYDRYQQGIEMLGSTELFVRLGGIYALRTLMKEYPQELHIPVVELLCAFLRNPVDADTITKNSRVRQDIQTALSVIVRRNETEVALEHARGFRLDLRNAHLQYTNLPGINLSEANLEGAILSNTNMDGANLSLAILDGADLSFANCRKSNFRNASLVETNLHHVCVDQSNFSVRKMDFVDCTEGSFYKTTFTNVPMWSCNFKGALLNETDLTRTYLPFGNTITQKQLNQAVAEANKPPIIDDGLIDPDTGKQLNWHGELPITVISRQKQEQQDKLIGPKPPGRDLRVRSLNRPNIGKPPSKRKAGYF